jgi:ATP-dependent exoDNAse (exonuclease V) beta subunit
MEERRLFYVALTRAKKRLTITHANERGTGAMKSSRMPSRFLSELPATSFQSNRAATTLAEEKSVRQQKTMSVLQGLRANLKPSTKP